MRIAGEKIRGQKLQNQEIKLNPPSPPHDTLEKRRKHLPVARGSSVFTNSSHPLAGTSSMNQYQELRGENSSIPKWQFYFTFIYYAVYSTKATGIIHSEP